MQPWSYPPVVFRLCVQDDDPLGLLVDMKKHRFLFLWALPISLLAADAPLPQRHTTVSIVSNAFYLNGKPTYPGRVWQGHKIEGLLLNSRMVQGIFDDRNPDTTKLWAYPDTGQWDPERNTREFIAALPEWRRHGLLAFTINLQGGSPQGYSQGQPWHNSAFEADGSLRTDYTARLHRIIDRADELGMVVIVGYFYFGQDQRLRDEAAVVRATDVATHWLLDQGWRNLLVEVNNECNVSYDHAILQPARIHELIERVKATQPDGRRLLVGTSYGGGTIPKENVVRPSDFLLIHGNGVANPKRIGEMVRQTRAVAGYTSQPILFNEDDHFNFDQPENNFVSAIGEYASWGFFDYRMKGEAFNDGYQSVPVNWGLSSPRKQGFFKLLAEITGGDPQGLATLPPTPETNEILLLSFFRDNGQNGTYLAASEDGLHFAPLHNDTPIFPPANWPEQQLTRDPSIVYHEGKFHVVWTSGWNGRCFGYANSPDLVHWSEPVKVEPFPASLPPADQPRNMWAPEIDWDPIQRNFAIIWSSTTDRESRNGDGSSMSGKDGDLDHRLYLSRTADGKSFTDAQLFFDQKFCCIDGQMTFDDQGFADPAKGRWIMVLKHEQNIPLGGKNLRLTFAPPDFSRPWTSVSAPIAGPGSTIQPREMAEGPTLVKWKGQWHLYWDAFANHHYSLAVSTDLKTWTDRTADLKMPPQPRHGTVFRAPRSAAAAALK